MKKISTLFAVSLIAVLAVGAYGGFIFFKNKSVVDQSNKNQIALEQLQNKVLELDQGRVLEAISAKKTSEQIYERAVYWSEIIKKLRDTIPEDGGQQIANITSYSGGSNKTLNLSIKTIPGRETPYLDVADLIEAFNESEYFEGSFVPGISSGLNDRGEEILTFSMSTTYLGEDFLAPDSTSQPITR